jgi:hypothetical protein
MAAGQPVCVDLIWRRGSKGLQRGRFLALRVRPAGVTPRRQARQDGGELPLRWLLVEWPVGKPEPTKYWLANLPETTPLAELVRLARLRWRVEQDYRELKGRSGWTTSKAVAGLARTTTSPWSRSRTASSPWSGCAAQNRRRRPDPVAAACAVASPACLLGRRLSAMPASRPTTATPNRTTTCTNLTKSY